MIFNKVMTGNYYEEAGFSTRYYEYDSSVCPPGLDEEKYDGDEVHRTLDGKFFLDYDEAKKHAETINIPELAEISDQIEQLKIVCTQNKKISPVFETITAVLTQLSGDAGNTMLEKYYDSTCY